MQLEPKQRTSKGSSELFDGDVYATPHSTTTDAPTGLAMVRFTPGAHTAWHSHGAGQMLHCTDGLGLVVSRDGTVIVLHPGDTVWTPPGEEHWHGATADTAMCHLALTGSVPKDADGPATTWGEKVDADDYQKASDQATSELPPAK